MATKSPKKSSSRSTGRSGSLRPASAPKGTNTKDVNARRSSPPPQADPIPPEQADSFMPGMLGGPKVYDSGSIYDAENDPNNKYSQDEANFFVDKAKKSREEAKEKVKEKNAQDKENAGDDSNLLKDNKLGDEKAALEKQGFMVNKISGGATPKMLKGNSGDGMIKSAAKNRARVALAGMLTGMLGSIMGFFFSLLPFELQHIANVLDLEIGGVKDTAISFRGRVLYSRAFFFHNTPDGEQAFDGYKERGMASFLLGKNFRNDRLLNQMRAAGFDPVPEPDADGNFTGRLASINGIDVNGAGGNPITKPGGFMDEWRANRAARSEIKKFFRTAEGPKGISGLFWKGRATRAVYQRWRIRRFDVFDGSINRRSQGAINRVRQVLRTNLIGRDARPDNRTRINNEQTEADADGNPDTTTTTNNTTIDRLSDTANMHADELIDNPGGNFRLTSIGEAIAGSAPKVVTGALVGSVSLLNAAQTLCEAKRIITALEVGARVLKAEALARFSGMFLASVNASTLGLNTATEVGVLTTMFNQPNPETGNDGPGSGTWSYVTNGVGTVHGNIRDLFAVGGGFVGDLANINNFLERNGANATTCDIVTNMWVQGASIVLGIAAAIFTGGVITAANAVGSLAGEVVLAIIEAIAVPLLIRWIAGTVVTFDEFGDEFMAALVSGFNVYQSLVNTLHSLRPITTGLLGGMLEQKERNIADAQADMGIMERYFSPNNARSFTAAASMMIPRSFGSATRKAASVFKNPLGLLTTPASIVTGNRAYAQLSTHQQCPDPDIRDNNLAADPFCNLIMAEDVVTLSITPEESLEWMVENEYVDGDGEPLDTTNGQRYQNYLDRCVNQLDIIHEKPTLGEGEALRENDNFSEFENVYTNFCFFDQTEAQADGTLREMSMAEAVALHNRHEQYGFDDLEVAMAIKDGVYEEESEQGKAYAGSHGATLLNIPITELQYLRTHQRDKVLMDHLTEHWSGIFEVNYSLDPVVITRGGAVDAPGAGVPVDVPVRTCNNPVEVSPATSDYVGVMRNAAPGTCIRLAAGNYTGVDSVSLAANVIIEGEAAATTVIDGSGSAVGFMGDSADVTIRNLTMQNYDNGGNNDSQENAAILAKRAVWAGPEAQSTGWLIDNVIVRDGIASGVWIGHETIITNSQFINNGITGVGGGRSRGGLIANNVMQGNGRNAADGQYSNGGGIKLTWVNGTSSRQLITGNTVEENRGGIWCDLVCDGVTIDRNEVHNNDNFGIFYELSKNAVIESNNVTDSSFGNSWNRDWANGCIATGESTDVVIRGNSVSDCLAGLVVRETLRPWSSETYFDDPQVRADMIAGMGNPPWTGSNITFQGNIVSDTDGIGAAIGPSSLSAGEPGFPATTLDLDTITFTGNTYSNVNSYWWNGQQLDLAGWRAIGNE